jgi:hypothetical protein
VTLHPSAGSTNGFTLIHGDHTTATVNTEAIAGQRFRRPSAAQLTHGNRGEPQIVREPAEPAEPPNLTQHGLAIDLLTRTLHIGHRVIDLTRREFDLLAYVTSRPGHVLTRCHLLELGLGPYRAVLGGGTHRRRPHSPVAHEATTGAGPAPANRPRRRISLETMTVGWTRRARARRPSAPATPARAQPCEHDVQLAAQALPERGIEEGRHEGHSRRDHNSTTDTHRRQDQTSTSNDETHDLRERRRARILDATGGESRGRTSLREEPAIRCRGRPCHSAHREDDGLSEQQPHGPSEHCHRRALPRSPPQRRAARGGRSRPMTPFAPIRPSRLQGLWVCRHESAPWAARSKTAARAWVTVMTPDARRTARPCGSRTRTVGVRRMLKRRTRSSRSWASTSTCITPSTSPATNASVDRVDRQAAQNSLENCRNVARRPSPTPTSTSVETSRCRSVRTAPTRRRTPTPSVRSGVGQCVITGARWDCAYSREVS